MFVPAKPFPGDTFPFGVFVDGRETTVKSRLYEFRSVFFFFDRSVALSRAIPFARNPVGLLLFSGFFNSARLSERISKSFFDMSRRNTFESRIPNGHFNGYFFFCDF